MFVFTRGVHGYFVIQLIVLTASLTNTARFNAITLQTVSILSVRSSDQQSTAHFLSKAF